jgi:RimJ/RimL family protein N-acetyltransferase
MQLLAIQPQLENNPQFINNQKCHEMLKVCAEYYKVIGFNPPWICYYAEKNGELVGSAGFKGAPKYNRVEIAYGTFAAWQRQGIGTAICKLLVNAALQADASVTITARTFEKNNASSKILMKNGFVLQGIVNDPEDGDVWEWEFEQQETC